MADSAPKQTEVKIDVNVDTTKATNRAERAKSAKYKPPPKKSVTAGLEFAPFARHIVTANMYILFLLGTVDLAMKQRMKFLGSGIYALCLCVIIYVWHFISDFNTQEKLEDNIDANLEPRGWPKIICVVLTFFANYLVQSIICVMMSVYLCFSPQTVLCGIVFVLAAIFYFVGFVRREKPKPITGII